MITRTLFIVISLFSSSVLAATETLIWGKAKNYVESPKPGLMQLRQTPKVQHYQLKAMDDNPLNAEDRRYQQHFHNIPIWGRELIVHQHGKINTITGMEVAGIEDDLSSTVGKLTALEVEQNVLHDINGSVLFKNTEKIIFLDDSNKAHLAYEVLLYTNNPMGEIANPHFIIDANSGELLKQWDGLPRKKIGQGLGGNVLVLPYRGGLFQHGTSQNNIPSLGRFDVKVENGRCYVETDHIRVINAREVGLSSNSFPILSIVEFFSNLPTFSYPCSEKSKYVNKNDNNTAPANHSFSAINDTMYFAGVTIDMYKNFYGIKEPLGNDLPVRAYTHIKHYDNAFAIPTIKIRGIVLIHQQIVIGDGDTIYTAPAQAAIAHELSHNFTSLHSKLIYAEQSGGINESFSDMAAIAMQDYLRNFYSWYWDGIDWSIGHEMTFGTEPIRYMDFPEKDGKSIGNAANFEKGMNVHDSSGVFNKAFYILAHKPDWSVRQAFQVMVDANRKYWTSGTHFDAAACGVIQAAIDRGYGKHSVVDAFTEVGVTCPLKSLTA
ncbi:MAG: M4 family peptidase [Legionella sp.]|nr:MAG: M4 family peptidase [Legionella sp.]